MKPFLHVTFQIVSVFVSVLLIVTPIFASEVTNSGVETENPKQNSAQTATETPDKTKKCLHLRQIRESTVLDSRHIGFRAQGGRYFVNELPRRCPGLHRNKAFQYKTSLPTLCDVDFITVLDSIGSGFLPGASCGLGKFREMSKSEYKEFKKLIKEKRAQDRKKKTKTETPKHSQ